MDCKQCPPLWWGSDLHFYFMMYNSSYIKIAPIMNPVQGDSIDLNILRHGSLKPQITEGIHRLYVEEVRESEVMLRGRGFKFLLPYEK